MLRKALRIWLKNISQDRKLADDIIGKASGTLEGTERLRSLNQEKIIILADIVLDLIEEGKIQDPRGKTG